MPVAFTSISTSPARGPSRSTSSIVNGAPAFHAMAALVFISCSLLYEGGHAVSGIRQWPGGILLPHTHARRRIAYWLSHARCMLAVPSRYVKKESTFMKQMTKTEAIVDSIKKSIIAHQLQPGTKLREEHLSQIFGVSRTLVRPALVQLSKER